MSNKKEGNEKEKAYEDPSETYNFEKPSRNQTRHLYLKLGAGGTGSSEEQHSLIIQNVQDLRLSTTLKSDSLGSVGRSNSAETSLIHIETQSRKSEVEEAAERNMPATAVKEKETETGPSKFKGGSTVRQNNANNNNNNNRSYTQI